MNEMLTLSKVFGVRAMTLSAATRAARERTVAMAPMMILFPNMILLWKE